MAEFVIRDLCKSYIVNGTTLPVLRHLDLTVAKGSLTVIVGRSGCGKTTLLRVLAGLETADSGTVSVSGKIGMVFQEPRLMPWLSVYDNVAFGVKSPDRAAILDLIRAVRLEGFEQARPTQLSGGMQHRAALARALAVDPGALLLDEPFAALDFFTRMNMQELLLELYRRSGASMVFVTHSIDEAILLASEIVILDRGKAAYRCNLSAFAYPRDIGSPELARMRGEILPRIVENADYVRS